MIPILFEFGASLFDSVLAIWFITRFIGMKPKPIYPIIAASLLFALTLFCDKYLADFNLVGVLICMLLALLYTVFVKRKITFRQILAVMTYWIMLMAASSLLFLAISSIIGDVNLLFQGSVTTARYIYLTLHKIILFAVVRLILAFFSIDGSINKKSAVFTFLISVATMIGLGMTMYVATLENSGVTGFQITVIALAFVMTNVMLYFMLSQIQRLQKSEYELRLLEEKTEFDNARHKEATALWQSVRNMQHEMKNSLSLISAQLDEGDTEACRSYLRELMPSLDSMGRIIRSDNRTLDYLINSRLGTLKDTQIVISGSVGDLSDIAEKDLASLMGNNLDNAVEAIEKVDEKRIELLFSIENTNRMIICKNTVSRPVLADNPDLASTKADRAAHGLGHKIVENIVAEYGGMIDYFEEDDMFGVQIILPKTKC
ncbi:MAG: GHKL domain-containing protein [Clostridia bacterium]|nr:GHKL domain-containing protein [Clostridia bacterium]